MSELKPCPFCGGEAETWDGAGPWHVVCTKCGTIGSPCLSEAEAIAAWNSRAERTCKNKSKSCTSFWCSKCDAATSDGFADVGGKLARFNYCPNCGRKCI